LEVEHVLTGSKLSLHHAEQQLIRLKTIVEHYQTRYPRAPLPPELGDVAEDVDAEIVEEDTGDSDQEGEANLDVRGKSSKTRRSSVASLSMPELPPYSPGMVQRPSSAFNAKVKVRVTPAEAALLARARQVGSYLSQQGDPEVLKEESLKLLEYVIKEELPLDRAHDRDAYAKAMLDKEDKENETSADPLRPHSAHDSKARGRLAAAKKVDRAIHWGEFMQGISAFQSGGREVKATIQGRLEEERAERGREGMLGEATHNFT